MPDNEATPQLFDCVVLGAGIAGVTVARNLQQRGLQVLLLEGSDRIGGRMYSKRDVLPDPSDPSGTRFLPLEAGAEYIHVPRRKRFREFWDELDHHGFTTSKFPKTTIFKLPPGKKKGPSQPDEGARNRVFFPGWERPLTTDEVLKRDSEIREASTMLIVLELRDLFDPHKDEDLSAGTFVRQLERKLDYEGRGLVMSEYTLSAHTPGMLDDPPPGHPPDQPNPNDTISVAGILKDEIQDQLLEPAEFRLELPGQGLSGVCGYDTLPRKICDEFLAAGGRLEISPPGSTSKKVLRVERTDGPEGAGVRITTEDGLRYTARTAVSTFSVGMLEDEGEAIFGDLLNEEKKAALAMVRMGPITKFSLAFKERLWAPKATDMSVLSNPLGKARTFFSAFPDEPENGPHVLTALMMSKDHRWIRDKGDEEAIQLLLDELQKVFDPQGERWTPERVLAGRRDAEGRFVPVYWRQDWEQDPFARGGNSYLHYTPPEQAPVKVTKAREALKNPRNTLPVFWAGEATAPAYDRRYQPLAVHGAYISGVRVAEDVRHWLEVSDGDAAELDRYYRKKYLDRGFFEKIRDFFADLFG